MKKKNTKFKNYYERVVTNKKNIMKSQVSVQKRFMINKMSTGFIPISFSTQQMIFELILLRLLVNVCDVNLYVNKVNVSRFVGLSLVH